MHLLHLGLDLHHLLMPLQHAGQDRSQFHCRLLLAQQPNLVALGEGHLTLIRFQIAVEDLQQSGLSGAVGADQGDAPSGIDDPVYSGKQLAGADREGKVFYLEHGLMS